MNIIEQFITDNKLDFSGSGSELNSNCCVLAGFALFQNIEWSDLVDKFIEATEGNFFDFTELKRVYAYANVKNYGAKWEAGDYKGTYIY